MKMTKDVAALESGIQTKGSFNKPRYNNNNNKNKPPRQFRDTHKPTQMEEQLGALYNLTRGREGYTRDIEALGQEGVDHINVSRFSNNKLGFLLAPSTKLSFKLFNRSFSTIENLMLFYRSWCSINVLPTADFVTGAEIRNNELQTFPHFANIYVIVCLGYVSIFKKYPALLKAMEQNTLVLDSYKTDKNSNSRVRPSTSLILVRAINEAYFSVHENRHPNLAIFLNRDNAQTMRDLFNDLPYNENFTFNNFIEDSFSPKNVLNTYNAEFTASEKEKVEKNEDDKVETIEATPVDTEDHSSLEETASNNQEVANGSGDTFVDATIAELEAPEDVKPSEGDDQSLVVDPPAKEHYE